MRAQAPLEPRVRGDKVPAQNRLFLLVDPSCEPAGSVGDAPGTGHEKVSAASGRRPQGPQDRLPCVLAENRAEAAGQRAKYRHRLSAENPTDVGRRPRKPVNRVLEHTRHRVVVFGHREEQPVRGDDASFSAATRSGISASAHASALCHQMSDQISTSTHRLTHIPRPEASPFKRPESRIVFVTSLRAVTIVNSMDW